MARSVRVPARDARAPGCGRRRVHRGVRVPGPGHVRPAEAVARGTRGSASRLRRTRVAPQSADVGGGVQVDARDDVDAAADGIRVRRPPSSSRRCFRIRALRASPTSGCRGNAGPWGPNRDRCGWRSVEPHERRDRGPPPGPATTHCGGEATGQFVRSRTPGVRASTGTVSVGVPASSIRRTSPVTSPPSATIRLP